MTASPHTHALDPLDDAEIKAATSVVREHGGLDETLWFETISIDENRHSRARRAYVCCYERSSNRTFSGFVDLTTGKLENWRHMVGQQARMVFGEMDALVEITLADPQFLAALKARGITDPSKVLVEGWAAGHFGKPEEEGKRIAYGHCWLMNEAGDNPYARPIANLHPVFDLAERKIIRIEDFGALPLPPDPGPIRRENERGDLREIVITQPDGPSFTVDGYNVQWQKWHIHVGYAYRDGLVLHNIGYEDKGRVRSIIHRASMAEMVVPYGDPGAGNYRRNAFDVGEHGVGQLLDSLALGCDCLGHIHYFDVWTHDMDGAPRLIKNAVCMHEEDYGIGWKFSVADLNQTSVTRSRRLVTSSIATIGNYVYGFFWYFYLDGTIGVEVKATGIPFPSSIAEGTPSEYGALLAPGIDSHVHQHVFSFRFDMAVDGDRNSAVEVDFEAVPPGSDNPYGNAIRTRQSVFKSEAGAQREMDLAAARYWKVINPGVLNRLGNPVGYKLVPGANALPFQHPDSPVGKRAAFMYKHFWVTRYDADELYPAGWFPNQHPGGDGLPRWTKADRPIEDEDIVVWYTLNYHHLPRPEDWPVQPVAFAGFHWMPSGFFDENPAIDVPKRKV